MAPCLSHIFHLCWWPLIISYLPIWAVNKRVNRQQNSWPWTTWIHIFFDNRCLFDIRNFIFNIFRKWWDYISRATAKSYENTGKVPWRRFCWKCFWNFSSHCFFLRRTVWWWRCRCEMFINPCKLMFRTVIIFSFHSAYPITVLSRMEASQTIQATSNGETVSSSPSSPSASA